MWAYLKDKAPEILVIVVIFGGGAWLFPRVNHIETEQSSIKTKVTNNEQRLERFAKASEVYGIKVAETEMERPIEIATFIVDLEKLINKKEYAAIVLSKSSNRQLVFRTKDYNEASIANAIAANYIGMKYDAYTPKISYLVKLCKSQGKPLEIADSIYLNSAIISRIAQIDEIDNVLISWNLFKKGKYEVKYDLSFLSDDKGKPCDLEEFSMKLTDSKIKELIQ